jgi:hypothetical protein
VGEEGVAGGDDGGGAYASRGQRMKLYDSFEKQVRCKESGL